MEHCISTFNAIQKEEAYRAYQCELLGAIGKQLGLQVNMNYFQVIDSLKPKQETRTAFDIVDSIKDKLNRIRGNENGSTGTGSKDNP